MDHVDDFCNLEGMDGMHFVYSRCNDPRLECTGNAERDDCKGVAEALGIAWYVVFSMMLYTVS